MTSKVSTAGIRLTEKRGLLDSCPRRFETKEEGDALGEKKKETKKVAAKPLAEQKIVQQQNNN